MPSALRLFLALLISIGAAWSATAMSVDFVTADGTYTAGDSITVTITFSGPVDVVAGTSRLRLALNRVADDAYAVATSSATGVTSANFTYVIRAGDSNPDLNYADNAALTGVTGFSGSLPAIPANRAVNVSTPLGVASVTSSPATGTRKFGDQVTITATLNRKVTAISASTLPSLKLATGVTGGTSVSAASVTGTVSALVFTYTVGSGQSSTDLDYLDSGALSLGDTTFDGSNTELALPIPGTAGSLGANSSLVIDGIAPTLTITTPATAQQTAPITYTITASETVTGLTATSLAPTNCTATLTGSATSYAALLTPTSPIRLSAAAAAGATSVNVDNISSLNNGDPVTIGGNVYFIATKTVGTAPAGTLTLSSPLSASLPNGTSIFPPAGISVGINPNAGAAQDAAGNGSVAASASTIYDPTPPKPIFGATTTTTSPARVSFTVTFTEPVATLLSSTGMTVANGVVATIDGTANPTFTISVTPTNSALPVTLTLLTGAVKDAANNSSLTATSTYDTSPPTVTVDAKWTTARNPAPWLITFNKPIDTTTLDSSDFTVPTGITVGTPIWNDAKTQATVPLNLPSGTTSADYVITVKAGAVTGLNGIASTDAPSTTVTYDPSPPVLTLTPPTTSQNTSPLTIGISASKPITGLTAGDCNVTNGTASGVNGSGSSYSAFLTPTASMTLALAAPIGVSTIRLQGDDTLESRAVLRIGDALVRLATTGVTTVTSAGVVVNLETALDAAIPANTPVWKATGQLVTLSIPVNACVDENLLPNAVAAVPAQVRYDPTPPMFSIEFLGSNLAGEQSFGVTASEPVTGFTATDLNVTKGVVASFSIDATKTSPSWIVHVTPTSTDSISLGVKANAAIDSAGNASQAEAPYLLSMRPYITKLTCDNANGTYGTGVRLQVKVTFSETVHVVGIPTLLLNLSASGRTALYVSGSDTKELLFDYTIVDGDATTDLDYASDHALALPTGASIVDVDAGNAADLALDTPGGPLSLAANASIVVNTGGRTDPGKPGVDENPSTSSGGCGSGSGIALILAVGWLGLGFRRRCQAPQAASSAA